MNNMSREINQYALFLFNFEQIDFDPSAAFKSMRSHSAQISVSPQCAINFYTCRIES